MASQNQPVKLLFVGNPNTKIYKSNVCIVEELIENLQREIFIISHEELQCMNVDSLQRCQEYMWKNGREFSISVESREVLFVLCLNCRLIISCSIENLSRCDVDRKSAQLFCLRGSVICSHAHKPVVLMCVTCGCLCICILWMDV
jgi:hypothetical protein